MTDEDLLRENSQLKKKNSLLMRELRKLSGKLDQALDKRNIQLGPRKSFKPRVSSVESLNHLQLNNAYKKCEIYKK